MGDARHVGLRSHAPDTRGLLRATASGVVTHADDTACDLLGLRRDGLVGERLARVIAAGGGPLEWAIENWIATAGSSSATVECRGSSLGGTLGRIELMALPGDEASGAGLLAALVATEHRGAGGDTVAPEPDTLGATAHELNNLLTVLLGNTDFLLDHAEGAEAVRLADQMRAAAMRGAELTARLLATAQGRAPGPAAPCLDRLLDRVVHRVDTSADCPDLRIDRRGQSSLEVPGVDPSAVEDARVAFCRAAGKAAGGGEDLDSTLSAKSDDAAAAWPSGVIAAAPVAVVLAIEARGEPTDADRRKFGEPWSLAAGRPETAAGRPRTEAVDDRAAIAHRPNALVAFDLEPPLADQPNAAPSATPHSVVRAQLAAAEMGHGERILLVEDDAWVRVHVAAQLLALGYDVISVEGGEEAVAALRSDEAIDLVFTDVVMSRGMSGWDVAARTAELRPGLAVLFTSGYARPPLPSDAGLGAAVHFLAKPYCRESLAAALRRVVAARRDPAALGTAEGGASRPGSPASTVSR